MSKPKEKQPKCRCYINAKTYAKAAKTGSNLTRYKPCPIHEKLEASDERDD